MVSKFAPLGFTPGFSVKEEDDDDVTGFNVRQEDLYPWISVGPEDIEAVQRGSSGMVNDPNVVPAAAGDLRCEVCGTGKASGTTGAWEIDGRKHCFKCAVKKRGVGDPPSSELWNAPEPFLLKPK